MSINYFDKLVKSLYSGLVDHLIDHDFKFDVTRQKLDINLLDAHINELPVGLAECYHFLNGIHLEWRKDEDCKGVLRLLKVEYLFDENTVVPIDNYKAFVIQDDPSFLEENKISGCFRIVDMYDDLRHMGFFSDPKLNFRLYLRDGIDYWDLQLDFEGYLKMAFAAKCFFDWPTLLIRYNNLKLSRKVGYFEETWNEFHEKMPHVFPGYNCDEFFALYDSIKLKS